jgi:hypothetical protein
MARFQRIGGWIGYALLILWEGYWLYLIASDIWSGTTHNTGGRVYFARHFGRLPVDRVLAVAASLVDHLARRSSKLRRALAEWPVYKARCFPPNESSA